MSELSPVSIAHAIETTTGPTNFMTRTFGEADAAAAEHARLDFELEGRLSLRFPATMTEAEVTHTFIQLAQRLAARTQCHLIIESVPLEVMAAILPQLQDMAEYEVRMWRVRQEVEGPDIRERWISLPITR